jgi:hypothetical protein
MSYTTLGGTGDNLNRIGDWRTAQRKLSGGDQLTSDIMMTSLSSAISQAARQNEQNSKDSLNRYYQEYSKLSTKRNIQAVAEILAIFDDMYPVAKRVIDQHLARSPGDQDRYAPIGPGTKLPSQDWAPNLIPPPALAIPQSNSKTVLMVVAGVAVLGLVAFIISRRSK